MKFPTLQIVGALASADPAGNSLKPGFDIDLSGLVPAGVKQTLDACVNRRVWSPRDGITVQSAKPIFPIYQGTTRSGWIHFKFPDDLIINVSNILVVRHIDIKMTDLMLKTDISELVLTIQTWPDVNVKL